VIGVAGTRTPFPAEAAPPDLSGITFPNIYDVFFRGPEAATLQTSLQGLGPTLKTNVDSIFDASIKAFNELGETMEKAGTEAARLGPAGGYARVAGRASELSESAFGAEAMRAKLVRRKDPIAEAYQSWLASSGFQALGKALPGYVAEMIEFWKKESRKPPDQRPTSPHILARRAQVTRVRMPRLVIRVGDERELDKVLAAEVADRVRFGVAEAFRIAVLQHEAAA
jgi:hypothetical protein